MASWNKRNPERHAVHSVHYWYQIHNTKPTKIDLVL